MKELIKGQKISLNKDLSLSDFVVALKYENNSNYDLDISVMMLSEKGKLEEEDDFIFYNNPNSLDGSIKITGSANSFENNISVNTNKIQNNISRLMFVMTINDGDKLNQRLENVKNISICLINNGQQVLEYKINDLVKETAVILMEIYKHNTEWKIQATGNGFNSGLDAILKNYGSDKVNIKDETKLESKSVILEQKEVKPEEIKLEKIPKGSIDFVKKHKSRIDLVKKYVKDMGIESQKSQVIVVMDISASMSSLFNKGIVQDTFDRVLPLAMQFDDDGVIDVWLFDSKSIRSKTPYTTENREDFVKKEILQKHRLGGGTDYAKPINAIVKEYKNSENNNLPLFILFFTDGNCFDKSETEKAMIDASDYPIFWKFIGMGGNKPKPKDIVTNEKKGFLSKFKPSFDFSTGFDFLEKLDNLSGRKVDNANFLHIYNLDDISDEDLYQGLLEELPSWLIEIKKLNMIN
ncbi:MAG: VWA domain-containing protein [Candidatus Sericytochromatia bacterium]|nr:VWA domain-containing protein [Candidatus Sericytochromatia bacterium]